MDKASLYEMTEGKEAQLSEKRNDVKTKMAQAYQSTAILSTPFDYEPISYLQEFLAKP